MARIYTVFPEHMGFIETSVAGFIRLRALDSSAMNQTTPTPHVRTRSPSEAVVEAVADADGVHPSEITPPLYEAIDPEALDGLFASTHRTDRTDGRLAFAYSGYEVTVHWNGQVSVVTNDVDD